MELQGPMCCPPFSIPTAGTALAWLRGNLHVAVWCFAVQEPKIIGSCNPAVNWRGTASSTVTAMYGFAVLDSHVTAIVLHGIG